MEYLIRLRDPVVLTPPLVVIKKRRLISCVACSVTQDGAAEVEGLDILLVLHMESSLLERSG